MQRVLDLDLDFFVARPGGERPFDAPRLDGKDHPPWEASEVLSFLEQRCGLAHPLPGRAVEHHGEVFGLWRDAIKAGQLTPPFHVTHVDAHADLCKGEIGYIYLLTEHLAKPPSARCFPPEEERALTDGNYLAFAIACRWIADLTYVYSPGGGSDIHNYLMEGFDSRGSTIRLPRLNKSQLERLKELLPTHPPVVPESHLEPPVPLSTCKARDFQAREHYDLIFLARSPAYTPVEADPIFEAIRDRFIDGVTYDRLCKASEGT
jgi:hypothetical protein